MAKRFDYLLLGGGTACGYAAAAIRDLDKNGTMAIVSADTEPPYDRPPFSKNFLIKEAMVPSDAHCKDESFYSENGIELLLETRAVSIDRAAKRVSLADGDEIEYSKMLCALGSEPRPLHVPGDGQIHLLRTAADAERIREAAKTAKSAAIVGGGYIGAEVAASLLRRGLSVALIEKGDRIWAQFPSKAIADAVQLELQNMGAEVHVGETVAEIGTGHVRLESGKTIPADLIVAGIGATPRTHIAKEAGLQVSNGVVADSSLKTEDPSIWVAGDVAEYDNPVLGTSYRAEHHLHAKASGAHAGKAMATDVTAPFDETPYFFSDVGELSMILRGYPERATRSFLYGDQKAPVLTEVHLFEDGTVAGVIDIRRDYKQQDPISDLFAELVKRKADASALESDMSVASFDVLSLNRLL